MEILLALGVLFNILVLAVLFLVLWELHQLQVGEGKVHRKDVRSHTRLAKKLETEGDWQLDLLIKSANESLDRVLRKHFAQITDNALAQTKNLGVFVQDQQKVIAKEAQMLTANSILKTERELEKYKADQLQKINSQITQIVFGAAREVLGRSISLTEHEDLVSQALERAKRDKFFA